MSSNQTGAAGPIEEEADETGRASSSQPHHSKSQESNLEGMRVKSTTTKDAGEAGGRDLYDYELYLQMEEREEEDGKRRQREERDREIKQMLQ
jgi:hypothetical protein